MRRSKTIWKVTTSRASDDAENRRLGIAGWEPFAVEYGRVYWRRRSRAWWIERP